MEIGPNESRWNRHCRITLRQFDLQDYAMSIPGQPPIEAQQCSAMLHGDIDRIVVVDRTGQTGNEAGFYGERLRVGLHFTQPNLPGSPSYCDSGRALRGCVLGQQRVDRVCQWALASALRHSPGLRSEIVYVPTEIRTSRKVGCPTAAVIRRI